MCHAFTISHYAIALFAHATNSHIFTPARAIILAANKRARRDRRRDAPAELQQDSFDALLSMSASKLVAISRVIVDFKYRYFDECRAMPT